MTIHIVPSTPAEIPFNISFTFNVGDTTLEEKTTILCQEYSLNEINCQHFFQNLIQLRYDYLERDMILKEFERNSSIINTQLIPNKHLLRSVYAINTEINNYFKEKNNVIDFERSLLPVIDQIVALLRSSLQRREEVNPSSTSSSSAMIDPLSRRRRNAIFIHSCSIEKENNRILKELIQVIFDSGLIKEVEGLIILNYGISLHPSIQEMMNRYSNIYIFHVSNDTTNFEVPTIKIMQESFQQLHINSTQIFNLLYLHTKGVSYRELYPQIEDWRHYMLYFLVERYSACLSLFESGEYDAIGVNYKSNPRDFRGNFWWASSSYLIHLPMLNLQHTDKYTAEKWLHMGERYRVYNLEESAVDHHRQLFPRALYEVFPSNSTNVDPQPLQKEETEYSSLCVGGTMYWKN